MRAPGLQLPGRAAGRGGGRGDLPGGAVTLDLLDGRVLRIVAGTYHVESPDGTLECSLRGRLKQRTEKNVSVGDRVRVERLADGSCRIRDLLPRASALSRRGAARRREQVIVANVDQVVAVAAVTSPEPDLNMLDRLLVLAELNGLASFVVLNKRDLLPDSGPRTPPDFAPYRAAGYDILTTSAVDGTGLEELRERLRDRTTVLSGQSGTGKSSLLNALMPGLDLRVGDVGERYGRGRHTTVAAALYPLAGGGYVADTPGLQYLALWEVELADLAEAFPDFRPHTRRCRFANCRHVREPACAVREAVVPEEAASGGGGEAAADGISERRYRSYLALLEEAEESRP